MCGRATLGSGHDKKLLTFFGLCQLASHAQIGSIIFCGYSKSMSSTAAHLLRSRIHMSVFGLFVATPPCRRSSLQVQPVYAKIVVGARFLKLAGECVLGPLWASDTIRNCSPSSAYVKLLLLMYRLAESFFAVTRNLCEFYGCSPSSAQNSHVCLWAVCGYAPLLSLKPASTTVIRKKSWSGRVFSNLLEDVWPGHVGLRT